MTKVKAIRGMNDILPSQTKIWREVESIFINGLTKYGYQEIRFPLLENTLLFKRTLGEVTDIVEKEMYTFADLNGDSLTLRPEGTASCVRACLENGLLHNQQQKLWYIGSMFRHERPQKGRYRQFTQLGVEVLGVPGNGIELELISLCNYFWQKLGIKESVILEINSLGTLEDRQKYKSLLVDYLKLNYDDLDQDSQKRLEKNPLRILDSKNPEMQNLISNAPKLLDSLTSTSKTRFQEFCEGLDELKINYKINPTLVRGLDYYGHLVFEWVTDKLGSQSTICAGGRYDALIEQLGGAPTSAVGFAMGIERMILLLEELKLNETLSIANVKSLFIIGHNEKSIVRALKIADDLRKNLNCDVIVNTAGGSFKSQFKKADKSGASLALIIGEEESLNDQISIKDLRTAKEQITIELNELNNFLKNILDDGREK